MIRVRHAISLNVAPERFDKNLFLYLELIVINHIYIEINLKYHVYSHVASSWPCYQKEAAENK